MREQPENAIPPAVLVNSLDDLVRGHQVQALLIAMGPEAVAPLGEFLIRGPALHPQPRMLAAEALGAIGGPEATDALIRALTAGDLSLPLAYRLPEEAVRSSIARELGRLGEPRATGALLEALARFHLVDAGAALCSMSDARAVPVLVECLDDAFIRERAAAVLVQFGAAAVQALVAGLARRECFRDAETRPSLERRAECARVLGEIGDLRAEGPLLACLDDADTHVRVAGAIAMTWLRGEAVRAAVVAPLIEGLHADQLAVVDECSDGLAVTGSAAVMPLVDALTAEATAAESRGDRVPDRALCAMARTLGHLGTAGFTALTKLAQHPQCFVRALAVANLGGTAPERAAPLLVKALRDRDGRVRRTAAARLKQLEARRHA